MNNNQPVSPGSFARKRAGQWLVLLFVICSPVVLQAQAHLDSSNRSIRPVDLKDVLGKILSKKKDRVKDEDRSGLVMLPSFGYNPSFGFIIGAKLSGGRQFGDPGTTRFSIFGIEVLYGTKDILTLKARHNVFTPANKWNWQGDWQVSRFGMVDYGLGTGKGTPHKAGFVIGAYPLANADSAFPLKYIYVKLFEKAYRSIAPHWYVGTGFSFDIFSRIRDEKNSNGLVTPHQVYSLVKGFDPERYSANGWLLALQYNNSEHPIRSYRGAYADLGFRFNQKWLGSTKASVLLQYDVRKYWSLSRRNPEHVLAAWSWATFTLSGDLPYLALPFTASDTYARSGRGYTLGRFKGPSFAYVETEYRFPITRNKLVSGVCFVNFQTASDGREKQVFESWEPGGGIGLRILFQKQTRSALCIDMAKGRYGSSGLFLGLNDAF